MSKHHRCALALGILSALSLCPQAANAQIVNVLNKVSDDAPDGLGGELQASLDWRSGNTELLALAGASTAIYRHGRHTILASVSAELGDKAGERYLDKDLEHLRYRLRLAGPLSLELFVQHDRNAFRRRALRAVFGGGPRLVVPTPEPLDLAFGLAYMPEYERLSEGAFRDSGATRWRHRLSGYASSSVRLSSRLELEYTLFVQPALSNFDDARVLGELGFKLVVIEPLSLRLSQTSQLDGVPPEGVRSIDATRKMSLVLEL